MLTNDTTTTSTVGPPKRLYKDPTDKMIAGVASGLAKFLGVDTAIVRIIWAASVLFGGFGALLYLLMWIILEDEPAAQASGGATAADRSADEEPPIDL